MCSWRVSSSCSTSGTRRVNLLTNPVISREWGQDREVFTTSGTYPWSFVTQIFHNGLPSHGDDRKIFEVMTSTLPKGTLGSVASSLAATLYQRNPDRNHKLWNIVSSVRYILHMQVLLECCYIYMESSKGENGNPLFCDKVAFVVWLISKYAFCAYHVANGLLVRLLRSMARNTRYIYYLMW